MKRRVGLLVAVEIEAVLEQMGGLVKTQRQAGFTVYTYDFGGAELLVIHAGCGEIAAAAATQLLISLYGVELVVNFGVVGGLTKEMGLLRCCVVEQVVHYDMDTSPVDHWEVGRYPDYPTVYIPTTKALVEKALALAPELKAVTCASGDKFVDAPEKKAALHEQFGAEICEMEAAGIVLTCNRAGVDCLLIKAVSDSITGGADEFSRAIREASRLCLSVTARVLESL